MTAPPPPGTAAPLTLAPSAAAAARGATTPSTRGVTLLRYEFVPAGVDGGGTARLEVDERTGEHTLTRPCTGGKPPIRFGGHAAARRPASGSLDGGGRPADTSEAADDDVECVAVYDGARWTLHAVEAAVGLRVQRAGDGDAAAAARRAVAQPSDNDDDDATTSDDELGAELEAALEEEEGTAAAPAVPPPAPARHTLPAAELNDVELEFLGRK